jgi:predicted RNase H-like HicB family nuclease
MDQPQYRIEIFWSDEDGGYIANVPALRYCSAFGESYEEALREVLVAMELHLDTLRELDRPIPDPEGRRLSKMFFENWVETLEDQAELNRRVLSNLKELKQQQDSRELAEGAIEAYKEFLDSMFDQYRSGREQSQRGTRN